MRLALLAGTLTVLASCGSRQDRGLSDFRRMIPDTVQTWAGRMTADRFRQTRTIENRLGLASLLHGTEKQEIRIWTISESFDPQVLFILQQKTQNEWSFRSLSFFLFRGDSINYDYTRSVQPESIERLGIMRYWHLPSQSGIRGADSYGCLDGSDILIEMADAKKYRLMWYRCADMNRDKDSIFLLVSELHSKLDQLVSKPY